MTRTLYCSLRSFTSRPAAGGFIVSAGTGKLFISLSNIRSFPAKVYRFSKSIPSLSMHLHFSSTLDSINYFDNS